MRVTLAERCPVRPALPGHDRGRAAQEILCARGTTTMKQPSFDAHNWKSTWPADHSLSCRRYEGAELNGVSLGSRS